MDENKKNEIRREFQKERDAKKKYKREQRQERREKQRVSKERQEFSLKFVSITAYLFLLMLLSYVVVNFDFVKRQDSFYFNFDIYTVGNFSHSIDNTLFIDDIPLGSLGDGYGVLLGGGSSYLKEQEDYEFTFLVKGTFTGTISIFFSFNNETRLDLKQDDFLGVKYNYIAYGSEPNLVSFEFYAGSSADFSSEDLSITIFTRRTTQRYEVENGQYFISAFRNVYDFIIGIFQPLTELNTTSIWAFLESIFVLIWNAIKGVIGL